MFGFAGELVAAAAFLAAGVMLYLARPASDGGPAHFLRGPGREILYTLVITALIGAGVVCVFSLFAN